MAKKYFKLPRTEGVPGVAVLYGSDLEIAQALAALRAAGQEPLPITSAEALKLKDAQRREDERERAAAMQKRNHAQPRAR